MENPTVAAWMGRPLIHTLQYCQQHIYTFFIGIKSTVSFSQHVQPSIAPLATHEHLPLLAFHSTKCWSLCLRFNIVRVFQCYSADHFQYFIFQNIFQSKSWCNLLKRIMPGCKRPWSAGKAPSRKAPLRSPHVRTPGPCSVEYEQQNIKLDAKYDKLLNQQQTNIFHNSYFLTSQSILWPIDL